MKQLPLPSNLVKKANQLVRSKLNITNVDGSKVLASLVAQLRHDDVHFKEFYTLNAKDVLSNTSGIMYARMKKLCRELAKTTAEVECVDLHDKESTFTVYTFFRSLEYKKGVITARFNEDMRPFLLNLKESFTQYHLMEYLLLPSFYSQRMFEILKSWSGLPGITLSLDELHKILDTPPSFKADFRQFRVHILEKAYKDIHQSTCLKFEWKPIKAGRSVESIKFSFSDFRKGITVKETKSAVEAKQRRLNNQRMGLAIQCSKAKKGICNKEDNKKTICELCTHFDLCGSYSLQERKKSS